MVAGKVFLACAISLLIGNVVYYAINPSAFTANLMSGIISFIISVVGILAITSVNIATFSLSDSFVSMAITITTLINLFFRVDILNYSLGFGLLTNMITLTNNSAFGLGGIIINAIGLIMFVTSMMLINGAGGA